MTGNISLLESIKGTVSSTFPNAKVMVFGSYARGDFNLESDIDLLVLLEKDKITYEDKSKITFPLFKLGLKFGIDINPIIYSRDFWFNKHKITPFYENVNSEGIML